MGYKCSYCGKVKENGSKVYFLDSIDGDYSKSLCSKECVEKEKNHSIMILENKIKHIKTSIVVPEIWED